MHCSSVRARICDTLLSIALARIVVASIALLIANASAPASAQPLTLPDAVWQDGASWESDLERYGVPLGADTGLWRVRRNPAGLSTAVLPHKGWVALSLADVDGDLHRPQHPSGLQLARLRSEGAAELSGWQTYGAFAYTRRNDRRVEWSAISDPHDRRAYVWADSIGGAWYRNHVDLEAALGSPQWRDRLSGGLRVQYRVGQGARRNDPRPQYRFRTLDVRPGLALAVHPKHQVGIHGVLRWRLEENEFGLFTTDDPFVYRLRGYGTFDRAQIVRGERETAGSRYGGSIQYAGRTSTWQWDAGIAYTSGEDEVRDGIRAPVFGGRHRVQEVQFSGSVHRPRATLSSQVRVDAGWWEGQGTDPVFQAVNVISEDAYLQVDLGLWNGEQRADAPWGVEGTARVDDLLRRDVVSQTEWSVTTLQTALRGWIQQRISSQFMMRARPHVEYRQPVAESYEARAPTRLTDAVVHPDYMYYSTAHWSAGIQAGIGWQPSDAASDRIRWSVAGDYSQAEVPVNASRRALRITIQVLAP